MYEWGGKFPTDIQGLGFMLSWEMGSFFCVDFADSRQSDSLGRCGLLCT